MPRRKNKAQKRKIIRQDDKSNPSRTSKKVCRFTGITMRVNYSATKPPYNFGCFKIKLINKEIILPIAFSINFYEDTRCKIVLKENADCNDVVNESEMNAVGSFEIPYDIIKILAFSSKMLNFFTHSSKVVGEFHVDLYFNPAKFVSLQEASELVINPHKTNMYKIIQYFLGISFDVYYDDFLYDENHIEKIYSCIKNSYDPNSSSHFSHEAFIPQLRPYQCQAVSWMLKREKEHLFGDSLHELFTAITLKDGHTLYFQQYGGFFVNQKFAPDRPCRGGLLADEMGLGKTLEILACILMNPRSLMDTENNENIENRILSDKNQNIEQEKKGIELKDDDELYRTRPDILDPEFFGCHCGNINNLYESARCRKCKIIQHPKCMLFNSNVDFSTYICPFCIGKDIVPSHATLIISPATIIYQWEEEILKHIKEKSLKVFIYKGVEHQKFIHPKVLSKHDIVLVSYETLKKELSHVDIAYGPRGHALRHVKRFLAIPSPLSSIEWWRICLDEAQMVENITSKVAQMIGKLHSINRWCVSGTPVKSSLEDLYGLFLFLDVRPYHQKKWWNEAILKPFVKGNLSPLSSALKSFAWATRKSQVFDQIGLSEVKVVIEELQFSAVERVYYNRKHSSCKSAFMENISKYDDLDINLPCVHKRDLNKLLQPMKILQQICCHFQITQENVYMHKKRMTTSELLSKLVKNVTYECEQIHREYIMACNGLGGIYMIEKDYQSAVEIFEKALQSIEDEKENIRTDACQLIHSIFQLSNAIKLSEKEGEVVKSKFKSSELDEQVKELSESYLAKGRVAVSICKKDFIDVKDSISRAFKKLKLKRKNYPVSSWWSVLFELLSEKQKMTILSKLPEVLEEATSGSSFKSKTSVLEYSVPALLDLLLRWSSEQYSEREELLKVIEDLSEEPDVLTVESAISCHLRPTPNSPKCKYCKAEDVFKSYESKLYIIEETTTIKYSEDNIPKEIVSRHRKHPNGPLSILLDFVATCMHEFKGSVENRVLYEDCILDSSVERFLMASLLKKEYQILRNVWKKYYDYVSVMDEVEMSKISVRIIAVHEKRLDSLASYCLYPHEVQNKKIQHHSDIVGCNIRLKKKLGHLFYLKNLEKAENKDGPFDENCPVCQLKIEVAWYVLKCGHCICINCTHQLKIRSVVMQMEGSFQEGFHCPLCREFNSTASINLLVGKNEEKEDGIPLKNFYSTKVNAVTRCLMQIKKDEPKAKSLVFSSFIDVLKILEDALLENGILSLNLCDRKNFHEDFDCFKSNPIIDVLLIPLNFGGSGLNIIEANHVILMEPVLDNSLHHQAIGRAHRIGQKKEVTVHRFIVKDSIEESIFAAMSTSSQNKHSRTDLTLQHLKNLFIQDL